MAQLASVYQDQKRIHQLKDKLIERCGFSVKKYDFILCAIGDSVTVKINLIRTHKVFLENELSK
jgi:hypothetical protein